MDAVTFTSLKRAVAASLIAAEAGLATADAQALDLLTIALARAVEEVGRKARLLAESANRAECSLDDVKAAMTDFEAFIGTRAAAASLPPLNLSVMSRPGNLSNLTTPELPQLTAPLAAPTEPKPATLNHFPLWLAKEVEATKTHPPAAQPLPLLPTGQGEEEARQILTRNVSFKSH